MDASGGVLRVNFRQDISTATAFTMTLEPEVGEKLDKVPTLGTVDVDVGDETFLANQYVNYTTLADDFTYVGRWRKKATATLSASNIVATEQTLFRVTG